MPEERNALEAFSGVRALPAWMVGVVLSPEQQAAACDLLREVMLSVEQQIEHDLALKIEQFLMETRPLTSPSLQ
jgi:hypothetical protein